MYGPYSLSDAEWCWRSEILAGSYGDADGNSTQWETNADTTFYHLPIHVGQPNMVIQNLIAEYLAMKAGSSIDTSISLSGYSCPPITISGNVIDHSWLHMLTRDVTTTDVPVGFYTHTVDLNTTTPNATVPSFEMLFKCSNAGDGSDILLLFCGCIITSYTESLDITSGPFPKMQGSYTIEVGNVIAGTDLTTWPSYPAADSFDQSHLAFTFNHEGSAINAELKSYTYTITNDRRKGPTTGSYFPGHVYKENNIDYLLSLVVVDYTNNFSKYKESPKTANDHDCSLIFTRTAAEDVWTILFTNGLYKLKGVSFDTEMLTNVDVEYNPEEASPEHQLIEVNSLDDDRYET